MLAETYDGIYIKKKNEGFGKKKFKNDSVVSLDVTSECAKMVQKWVWFVVGLECRVHHCR